jgi:hypothetical protein
MKASILTLAIAAVAVGIPTNRSNDRRVYPDWQYVERRQPNCRGLVVREIARAGDGPSEGPRPSGVAPGCGARRMLYVDR